MFEPIDQRLVDAEAALDRSRYGKVGADVEKLVLDTREDPAQLVRHVAGEDDPECRVELVDGAERLDATVELRDPRPVSE